MEQLESLLNNHDWHYLRSDDHRKYLRGKAQQKAIQDLILELGQEAQDYYYTTLKRKMK